jgi:acyl-CoA thioesterase-1
MSRVLSVLLLLTLMGCDGESSKGAPSAPSPQSQAPPVVVVLGDSLSAGPGLPSSAAYPALLQQRAADAGYGHRIVNAGVSGDTTSDGLRRLDGVLTADTRVLVVALGANDGLRGVPVATVKRNLADIIARAKSRGTKVLLAGMETPPSRGWQYSVDFHFIYPDLAREHDVPLMPFLLAGVFGDAALNLPDGFHPNAAGMRVIADAMWPYLEPLLRETAR